ncbi:MAG TPA: hypothetical protein DEH02_01595 [Bacteroidales bacterium]|nr:MAG: hypothetical protein A2X01_06535 [Bacteroidetes bacterium GWF2_35_48]OFY96554.1 MAG: hypothetical protein A2491_09655 [Bacteroidetes bacterium RIFOXYC12_FULL_35_7]HBX49744.1 hypothetical protein [Bacteroidales bacterium]
MKRIKNKYQLLLKLIIIFFVSIFLNGCFALSFVGGGTGLLKSFVFSENSKKDINTAIHCLFSKYPQYIPPDKYENSMIHMWPDLSTPDSRRFNADTVQFHFYIKTESGREILFWTRFRGLEEEWLSKAPELALIGYKEKKGLQTNSDFGIFRPIWADKNVKLFQKEILPKIEYLLKHPTECK